MMLWEVDIYPAEGQPDRAARQVAANAAELGLAHDLAVTTANGFLIQGELDADAVGRVARHLLADAVVERFMIAPVGDPQLAEPPLANPRSHCNRLVHVMPKPGVMDPVAQSTLAAIRDFGLPVEAVRTLRKYWFDLPAGDGLHTLAAKLLANDAIEQVVVGPLKLNRLEVGSEYRFQRVTVPLGRMDDAALSRLSLEGQLYLSLEEMLAIQAHFRGLGRDPTDAELETLAQTWSEHCSHKTLAGPVNYSGPDGPRQFKNMLKETIFAATQQFRAARRERSEEDWCVSVFEDNAGVVRFDHQYDVVFKVETHNHPSALEPYGGANTGLGGVIRDPLGTGLGAKPVCNTDVFCFAPPDTPPDALPPGVLHPRRVMQGVVAGVRDYGNRMGIPTVNGAIYFDPRYLGNPLVYCGNVGLLPRGKSRKASPQAGDSIVVIGGRTGRDGIHGATFSSAELTSQSESLSGGAVQIGNAITEKMVLDVLLAARDRGLFRAVTDCGAGGLSSAIGEMGQDLGAVVWLDRVPLKYHGLSYTEIWISEAQERMVLAVPPEQWPELATLAASEGVEATVIGEFVPSGRLELQYAGERVAELTMEFLHDGRPAIVRNAVFAPPAPLPLTWPAPIDHARNFTATLSKILGSLNVCSKEWVIRQYDHEVQGGSVVKPLVGAASDGPSDAAVIRPVLASRRGLVIACGMNPRYGELDPYHMAAGAIDEALRNCIAVGADPARIAVLDNFCWGDCTRPETLGSLVRAAQACYDMAIAMGTPFISGKDSLNNEFRYADAAGERQTIAVPPSLLISAMGQIDDVSTAVTMDLKYAGGVLYQVGATKDELGGSHFALVESLAGGQVPRVNPPLAKATFAALHRAIQLQLVRACHDLSEGGLAVAAAEMAFAGQFGARIFLEHAPHHIESMIEAESASPAVASQHNAMLLFAESNSRFLCEVAPEAAEAFEEVMGDVPHSAVGEVLAEPRLQIVSVDPANPVNVVDADIDELKEAWQSPLRW
ncbi:MAG TPA: phosphoribosylformylglycinamidine synthase subunit PurL [Pirellulales bacterium]|nr:phosphoribosylformylglycinamidine synthase subunit PurL [Pirellulales bacterium]